MADENFIKFANSFQAVAKLRLKGIERLLYHLDNPQEKLKFIHIAGTNGKGSVAAYLQCILTDAGYKTGKYISPNMISVCERVSVDGENIDEKELEKLLEKVRKAAILSEKELLEYPTQFEIWTAAAFLYFLDKKCDIVVLETGLGGTRDATNIIPPPLASVITHIALDHTQYLGNTLAEIAGEKAGIIKRPETGRGLTITSLQDAEALKVLEKNAKDKNNDFIVAKKATPVSHDENGECFNYKHIENISSSMLGLHQLDNAALAIETVLRLNIPVEFIKSGIKKAKNIGRFEIISKNPLIVFDGAHNPDGMRALSDSLNRYFPEKSKDFLLASMEDKDIKHALCELYSVHNKKDFYTVSVKDNPRSMSSEALCELVKNIGFNAYSSNGIGDALKKSTADMLVICGSLYLYKDFYEHLKNDDLPNN